MRVSVLVLVLLCGVDGARGVMVMLVSVCFDAVEGGV